MSLADNTLHPLEIADARDAAFRASELQRDLEQEQRRAGRRLNSLERAYRRALSKRMWELHNQHGVGWSTCYDLARGEEPIPTLRKKRDDAQSEIGVLQQQGFRRGADRKDVTQFIEWSMKRDLRTDVEPRQWNQQPTFGRQVA